MIIATSIEDAHFYGDIIPSIYKLRHQGFRQRQTYDVPDYKGMEYDTYDTPATTYLAWRDDNNIVRGCTRLFPTTRPYMIEEIWPESVKSIPLPKDENIWEASRFCIDRSLPVHLRRQIHGELLCGFQEFGLREKINWMIGVMTPPIWRSVFERSGWPIEYLGEKLKLAQREEILTGKMNISPAILANLRRSFAINYPVLSQNINNEERKRA